MAFSVAAAGPGDAQRMRQRPQRCRSRGRGRNRGATVDHLGRGGGLPTSRLLPPTATSIPIPLPTTMRCTLLPATSTRTNQRHLNSIGHRRKRDLIPTKLLPSTIDMGTQASAPDRTPCPVVRARVILTQQRVIRIRKSKRGKLLLTTLLPITNRGQRESESKSKMGADMSAEMGAEAIIIDRASRGTIAILVAGITNE